MVAKVKLILLIICLVGLAWLKHPGLVVAQSTVWSADFETGDLSQWQPEGGFIPQDGGKPAAFWQIVTQPARGQYAAALIIDLDARGSSGGTGAYLFRWQDLPQDSYYYSAYYYIPSGIKPDGWWNIFQWKSNGGNRLYYLVNVSYQAGRLIPRLDYHFGTKGGGQPDSFEQAGPVVALPTDRWFLLEGYFVQSRTQGQVALAVDGQWLNWNVNGQSQAIIDLHPTQIDAQETINWSINNYTDAGNRGFSPRRVTIYVDDAAVGESARTPGLNLTAPAENTPAVPTPTQPATPPAEGQPALPLSAQSGDVCGVGYFIAQNDNPDLWCTGENYFCPYPDASTAGCKQRYPSCSLYADRGITGQYETSDYQQAVDWCSVLCLQFCCEIAVNPSTNPVRYTAYCYGDLDNPFAPLPTGSVNEEFDPCARLLGEDKLACQECLGDDPATAGIWTAIGCVPIQPSPFAASLVGILFQLAGGVGMVLFLIAAFLCATSQGDPQKVQACRETATSVVVGILMLIFSLLLIRIVFGPGGFLPEVVPRSLFG